MSDWAGGDFLPFDFKYADFPVKDLTCKNCNSIETPAKQFRLRPNECGQETVCIGWVCQNCESMNLTPDDVSILESETIHTVLS